MSKETEQAFEEALAAHIADENDGALLTDYLCIGAAVPADGDMDRTQYQIIVNDTAALHTSRGLIEYARTDAEGWQKHPDRAPE